MKNLKFELMKLIRISENEYEFLSRCYYSNELLPQFSRWTNPFNIILSQTKYKFLGGNYSLTHWESFYCIELL